MARVFWTINAVRLLIRINTQAKVDTARDATSKIRPVAYRTKHVNVNMGAPDSEQCQASSIVNRLVCF